MACLGAVPPVAFLAPKRLSRRFFQTALFLFLLNVIAANAQNFAGLEQGIKPYGSYEGGDIDSISVVNGSLTLHIPLISYPQRGGKLSASFSLVYANPILQPWATCNPRFKICNQSGYDVYYGQSPGPGLTYPYAINAVADFVPKIGASFLGAYYMATEPDGAVHQLGEIGSTPGVQYLSADATGYAYVPYGKGEGLLTDRQGTRYDFTTGVASARFEDANGNLISTNSNQGTVTGWTDSMGRVIPAPSQAASDTNLSHCPSSATSATLWSPPGPNGRTSPYEFCWATIPISFTAPDCTSGNSGCQPTSTTNTQMVGLVLPNLTTWTFAYDSLGELTSVTFPTGGSISYAWTYIYGPCVAAQYVDPGTDSKTALWPYRRALTSRTVNANDGTGAHVWNYFPNTTVEISNVSFQTVVTDPLLNDTVHTETALGSTCSLYETQTDRWSGSPTSGTKLQTTTTTYNFSSNSTIDSVFGLVAINVVPSAVTTTDWLSGKTSQVTKTFDSGVAAYNSGVGNILYGELLTKTESDFGNGSPGGLLRQTVNKYMALSGPNANYYLTYNLLSLPYTVEVEDGSGNQKSLTQYNYDENTPSPSGLTSSYQWITPGPDGNYRGNNTSVLHWLNSGTFNCPNGGLGGSNSYLISKKTYFDDGMLSTSADPCGNTSTFAYNLTYWGALPTTVTNALNQATTNTYDFNTSLLASTTDPNNLTTTYCSSTFCYDSMWRITEVSHPDGGLDTITHQEVTPPFTATLTSTINSSQNKIKTNVFDGLGRITQTQLASDPQNPVLTNTTYDALGRIATESNPYRSGTDATSSPGTTTYGYDALSRKITVAYQDNVSVLNTAYCGPSTLVTDPTGKWRRSRVNGLGQLVEVDEPNSTTATVSPNGCPGTGEPIWVTSYTNDALGNLLQAVQNSSRTRTFTYDSISRLLTSVNPESGATTYTYNPDGPVLTKQDARSITASYTYDALHRTLGVSYSNDDTSLGFSYDGTGCLGLGTCQNIGYRTGMTDAAGSETWSYEVDKTHFRSIHIQQRTNDSSPSNITKTTTSYLDLAGNVTQLVYPTGRTVNYYYDSADRPSNAADSSNGITYVADWKTPPASTTCTATAVCYTPQGSVYGMSIGQTSSFTGFNILENFSSRLQPNQVQASSTAGNAIEIAYNFVDPVTTHNDGVVYGITNNLNSSRSQTFTYDQLNRITSAGTSSTTGTYCWGYQYNYDTWGNLLSQAGSPTYNACTETNMAGVTANANNQISGLTYDAAGNTLTDGNYTYTWNGESELKTAAGVTYGYDGDGRRVAKSGSKLYWYGSGGEILSETDASGNTLNDYVFFGGKRVALVPGSGSALYYAEDMLGSSRVMVQSNGTLCYDGDFVPFGAERPYTSTCSQNYKFEGKERDTETANDNFDAREYTWRFGRWLSSDWSAVPVPVPYANLSNPQTLNLYGMVEDDPESFCDLDGHWSAPYEWANWADSKINAAVNAIENKAVASGSPALAFTATFAAGVTGDIAKGFTNLLRTGESVGSLPSGASGGQVTAALAEEGGRVGGTILAVVAIAGPKTPASSESGVQVAREIGNNRVTLGNGSQVDLAGKPHIEKTTGKSVATPHIKDPTYNTNPNTGVRYQNNYGPTRAATVGDVNNAARTAGARTPGPSATPLPTPQERKNP